jgi:hypothetical protein
MSTNNTYLAVFLGSKTSSRVMEWNALPEDERQAKKQEGIAAWKSWAEKHEAAMVSMGGPLGKTKKVSEHGIQTQATRWGPSWSFARIRMKRPPSCSRSIHTSRSFRANPWRSCRFYLYRTFSRRPWLY